MRPLAVSLFLVSLVSCSTTERLQTPANPKPEVVTQRLQSPVDLRTAILTLPTNAVAGMSERGRNNYLRWPTGDFQEKKRRIELFCDNAYSGIDADSILFLRLFEDEQGRTVAASHSARPRSGSNPSEQNTSILRVEGGVWRDITEEVMPAETPRDWYFKFNEPGSNISCGTYVRYTRADGRGQSFDFGKVSHVISWVNGRFKAKKKLTRHGWTTGVSTSKS